jgi:hypothetical protein
MGDRYGVDSFVETRARLAPESAQEGVHWADWGCFFLASVGLRCAVHLGNGGPARGLVAARPP